MNMPIMPRPVIATDSPSAIMSRSGELVGLSKSRAVWRFGFLPESDAAQAYGVSTPAFLWVCSDYNGRILDIFEGYALELPKRYRAICDAEL